MRCGRPSRRARRTNTAQTLVLTEGTKGRWEVPSGLFFELTIRRDRSHPILEADPRSPLRLPTRTQIIPLERPLKSRGGYGCEVEDLFARCGVNPAILNQPVAAAGGEERVVLPAPILVQEIEQVEHIHRQLHARPTSR